MSLGDDDDDAVNFHDDFDDNVDNDKKRQWIVEEENTGVSTSVLPIFGTNKTITLYLNYFLNKLAF